jgi:hypothetical protein
MSKSFVSFGLPALAGLAGLLVSSATSSPLPAPRVKQEQFTKEFFLDDCTFSSIGSNRFFPLQPGAFLILEGFDHDELERVVITVLDDIKTIQGIDCRVVEEIETVDGELVEISRNFLAQCNETGDVFYFGEEVDIYEDGVIVGHDGAWEAFSNGAMPGILMPGRILHGSRYFQEIAPGVAEDRAEHVDFPERVRTPAGTFTGCLVIEESTPLEPGHVGTKAYAPGIGLVRDGDLKLVAFGD